MYSKHFQAPGMYSKYPCIPGHELVGTIVEVGGNVEDFKVGDKAGIGTYVGKGSHHIAQIYRFNNLYYNSEVCVRVCVCVCVCLCTFYSKTVNGNDLILFAS